MKKTIEEARKELETRKTRSAWERGVTAYALDLLDSLEKALDYYKEEPADRATLEKYLLNGATDWSQYSWGGSALIYEGDIAERVCTPSELKKTRNGERRPNSREEWFDTQARALYQAARRIKNIMF